MKRPRIVLACVAVLAALVLPACTSSAADSRTYRFTSSTAIGKVIAEKDRKPIESYSGPLLSGGRTTLAAQSGAVTVVNFWASWCTPCQVETPQFNILYRKLEARDVKFVGIDFKDTSGAAKAFVEANDISYPMFYDPEGQAQIRLGNVLASGPPFTLVLDRHHDVAAAYVGRQSDVDLNRAIDTLLAEK